jgi:hypothetical protein
MELASGGRVRGAKPATAPVAIDGRQVVLRGEADPFPSEFAVGRGGLGVLGDLVVEGALLGVEQVLAVGEGVHGSLLALCAICQTR